MLPISLHLSSHMESDYHTLLTPCASAVYTHMCTQTGSAWWPPVDIAMCLCARGKAACLSPMCGGDFH